MLFAVFVLNRRLWLERPQRSACKPKGNNLQCLSLILKCVDIFLLLLFVRVAQTHVGHHNENWRVNTLAEDIKMHLNRVQRIYLLHIYFFFVARYPFGLVCILSQVILPVICIGVSFCIDSVFHLCSLRVWDANAFTTFAKTRT